MSEEMADLEYWEGQVEKLQNAADTALARLQEARAQLSAISARGRDGEYAPRATYEAAAAAVAEAGRDHQRALKGAGKAKREANRLRLLQERAVKYAEGPASFYQNFVRIAKAMLPRETYDIIAEAASNAIAQQTDTKARELTGRALPALGSTGGFRERSR